MSGPTGDCWDCGIGRVRPLDTLDLSLRSPRTILAAFLSAVALTVAAVAAVTFRPLAGQIIVGTLVGVFLLCWLLAGGWGQLRRGVQLPPRTDLEFVFSGTVRERGADIPSHLEQEERCLAATLHVTDPKSQRTLLRHARQSRWLEVHTDTGDEDEELAVVEGHILVMGRDAAAVWQGNLTELLRKLEYDPTASGACVAKEHILRAGDKVRISGEASVEADPRQAGTYRHVSSAKFFRGRAGAPVIVEVL
jgi:hypothetical protein